MLSHESGTLYGIEAGRDSSWHALMNSANQWSKTFPLVSLHSNITFLWSWTQVSFDGPLYAWLLCHCFQNKRISQNSFSIHFLAGNKTN